MATKKHGEPPWMWRRVIIFPVVAWACYQLHILINAPDTRVNETIAYGWMMLIGILILGYTGFATAQDVIAIWRTGRALPYREDADPAAAITPDEPTETERK
ncbi:hypothetical protein [Rhizobium rhizogenes]|uniref:hypothetical protein n=1 Tax=Rhizobium rhizogenes TaxID=359 RepID=UPI0015748E83|nr:hypothetical protein [Rhizobium rhizogenes]